MKPNMNEGGTTTCTDVRFTYVCVLHAHFHPLHGNQLLYSQEPTGVPFQR